MKYTVRWNQVKGEQLKIGQMVQWIGIKFRVDSIDLLPETKATFNDKVHYFDNARLQVTVIEDFHDNVQFFKESLESGEVAVGPIK